MLYHDMERIMRKERIRLGLMDYDQHALRYQGVMELADANCTDDQIASYSGHTTKAMIVKYAGMARQKRRALEASQMRTRHENESQTKQETDTKGDTR